MRLLGGFDNAGGDDVAIHDSAEDVDEDSFYVGVTEDDFECRGDLLFAGAAADVEEIRGTAAVMLDDIHGGHRETSAVHKARDVPIQLDVIQAKFAGLDFKRRFFGQVAHVLDI